MSEQTQGGAPQQAAEPDREAGQARGVHDEHGPPGDSEPDQPSAWRTWLPAHPHMARVAATFTRTVLGDTPGAANAEQVVSELALLLTPRAVGSDRQVELSISAAGEVIRVELGVWGAVRRADRSDDERGRVHWGYVVLDVLAARWGHEGSRGGPDRVCWWAEIARDDDARGGARRPARMSAALAAELTDLGAAPDS